MKAYIALGANLGDPAGQVRAALAALVAADGVKLIAQSSLYRTAPMGLPGQGDYCNAACVVDTALTPEALFAILIGIERAAGRVRDGRRWGPRVLDLDLLHCEGQTRATAELTLPHPEIAKRNFVLVPLAEVAPALVLPGVGNVVEAAAALGREGLVLWT